MLRLPTHPITEADKGIETLQKGVSCPHCYEHLSYDQQVRFTERQKQVDLALARGQQHIGAPPPATGKRGIARYGSVEQKPGGIKQAD